MTCIIGHVDGWMVADTRLVFSFDTLMPCQKTDKIKRFTLTNGEMLVGMCGEVSKTFNCLMDIGLSGIAAMGTRALVEAYRKEEVGECLAVTNDGLFRISAGGSIHQCSHPFWGVGSGAELAISYMEGAINEGSVKSPMLLAQKAVQWAHKCDLGTGPVSTVHRLDEGGGNE